MPQFSPTNLEGRDRIAHIEDFIQNKLETVNRSRLAHQARGLITEAYPISAIAGATTSSPSIANASAVGFRAGDIVTNIHCLLTSEGASQAIVKTILWDASGTLLAVSANQSTAFTTTSVAGTITTIPLSSPYTILTDGGYYIGIVSVGDATPITLGRASTQTGVGKAAAGAMRAHMRATGQSDAGSVTLLDSSTAYWFAAS